MTTGRQERLSEAYEKWCEEHNHDPYSPHAARHFAAVMDEAEQEYQQWLEDREEGTR